MKSFQVGTTQGKDNWHNLILIHFSALADVLYIYPFKSDKKTFDQDKDELGFATKPKLKKKKNLADYEREAKEKLLAQEQKIKRKQITTINLSFIVLHRRGWSGRRQVRHWREQDYELTCKHAAETSII